MVRYSELGFWDLNDKTIRKRRPTPAWRAGAALVGNPHGAWRGNCEAIVHRYGRDEFLRRLAHPFWFQSFGAVMGMDWHSSGITTSVIGALKRGLTPWEANLASMSAAGGGKHSRKTPDELTALGERVGFDGAGAHAASRLVAKVDSAAVQDGFDLYLHGFSSRATGSGPLCNRA